MDRKAKTTETMASETNLNAAGAAGSRGGRGRMKQLVAAVNRGDATFWTRIGVAFENRDGSWTLKFDVLPTSAATTIQLRELRPRETAESSADGMPGIIATHYGA